MCLLVDSEEPLRERFVRVARQRGLSARTRKLPVGDFLWVLLPLGVNPDTVRDMPDQELVCKNVFFNHISITFDAQNTVNYAGFGIIDKEKCRYLVNQSFLSFAGQPQNCQSVK